MSERRFFDNGGAELLWCVAHVSPALLYHDGSGGCWYEDIVESHSIHDFKRDFVRLDAAHQGEGEAMSKTGTPRGGKQALTIEDLRVTTGRYINEMADGFHSGPETRAASLADLIEVLEELGAEKTTLLPKRRDSFAPGVYGLKPGSYIVWRIEE